MEEYIIDRAKSEIPDIEERVFISGDFNGTNYGATYGNGTHEDERRFSLFLPGNFWQQNCSQRVSRAISGSLALKCSGSGGNSPLSQSLLETNWRRKDGEEIGPQRK